MQRWCKIRHLYNRRYRRIYNIRIYSQQLVDRWLPSKKLVKYFIEIWINLHTGKAVQVKKYPIAWFESACDSVTSRAIGTIKLKKRPSTTPINNISTHNQKKLLANGRRIWMMPPSKNDKKWKYIGLIFYLNLEILTSKYL